MKTEEAHGWGLRVGGSRPYLAYAFSLLQEDIKKKITQEYHRPVKVVVIPLSEWKRFKKMESEK